MDMASWPEWAFGGVVGLIVALLTRSGAVRTALITARQAPYEAMAARLAKLEEEHDRAEAEQDALRQQWETERRVREEERDAERRRAQADQDALRKEWEQERDALKLAWAHERAQLVSAMGALAHELYQLKADRATEEHPRGSE